MADFTASLPPELDNVPSTEGPLPPPSALVGRPYALPVDILVIYRARTGGDESQARD